MTATRQEDSSARAHAPSKAEPPVEFAPSLYKGLRRPVAGKIRFERMNHGIEAPPLTAAVSILLWGT